MLLGRQIVDTGGVEGASEGLGLLPFDTVMHPTKLTRPTTIALRALPPAWSMLDGLTVTGYEIRNGRLTDGDGDDRLQVSAAGNVLATTVHGLLEDPGVLAALFGRRPIVTLDDTFEQLADAVDAHLDTDLLHRLVGER